MDMRHKGVTILDVKNKESEALQTVEKRHAKPEFLRLGGNAAGGKTLSGPEGTVFSSYNTPNGATAVKPLAQGPS